MQAYVGLSAGSRIPPSVSLASRRKTSQGFVGNGNTLSTTPLIMFISAIALFSCKFHRPTLSLISELRQAFVFAGFVILLCRNNKKGSERLVTTVNTLQELTRSNVQLVISHVAGRRG